jgi:hypothetical protein
VTDGRTHTARADGSRRRTEESKIRRQIVTLRAAGPRVARSSEPMNPKHKHPLSSGVFVFGDHCLARSPAVGRRPAACVPARALLDPRGAPGGRSFQARCGYPAPSPSDLRFSTRAVGSCKLDMGLSPELTRDSSLAEPGKVSAPFFSAASAISARGRSSWPGLRKSVCDPRAGQSGAGYETVSRVTQ